MLLVQIHIPLIVHHHAPLRWEVFFQWLNIRLSPYWLILRNLAKRSKFGNWKLRRGLRQSLCGGTCRTMITLHACRELLLVCYLGGVDRRSHSGLIYSIIRKVDFLPLLCYKIFAWHHHCRSTWPLPGLTVSTMAQSLFQRYSGCMVALTSTKCKCGVE